MSRPDEVRYLATQIDRHLSVFFQPEARQAVTDGVRWLTYQAACECREPLLVIPTDVAAPLVPEGPYEVCFNETRLTLWNRLPKPEGWRSLPDDLTPLWYQSDHGALMPAWNLFATLFDLLTLREERDLGTRDGHGRFIGAMSPRAAARLLEVPAFNEAVAALAGAAVGMSQEATPRFDLDGLLRAPWVLLSHDNDLLRGNDPWTQAVRLYRVLEPLRRGRAPHLANLYWAIHNALRPHDYYFDNVRGMVEVERMVHARSTFYFLNGTAGRFGARSGSALLPATLASLPDDWVAGIHYNFDTLLHPENFKSQLCELERLADRPIRGGRAHYLRFDPERSFGFLRDMGMVWDESVGYPDRVGYRAGIAGGFQPYDRANRTAMPLTEVPLVVMDGTLLEQYPTDPVGAFSRLLAHLSKLGGALTLLFHPGVFFNPEHPAGWTIYRRMLGVARDHGARLGPVPEVLSVSEASAQPVRPIAGSRRC